MKIHKLYKNIDSFKTNWQSQRCHGALIQELQSLKPSKAWNATNLQITWLSSVKPFKP
jgi:hypothetical protein